MEIVPFIIIILIPVLYFILKPKYKKYKRKKIMEKPFLPEWEKILKNYFELYNKLPVNLQEELKNKIKVFLKEKVFYGCQGMEITDKIRIIVAAQACILLLNRQTSFYPKLKTIYIYPTTYFSKNVSYDAGIVTESTQASAGESWNSGELVLAWDASIHGATNTVDGHNVVFHEFAHQLDQEDGFADGAPILKHRSCYASWARVLGEEFERLKDKKKRRKKSVLNKYGATNPAEFFAVASETFFEKPRQLNKRHPELYEELKNYYNVNPIEWMD